MMSLSRRLFAAGVLIALTATGAQAHGLIGKRFFPATLAIDDPFVADELSPPTETGTGVHCSVQLRDRQVRTSRSSDAPPATRTGAAPPPLTPAPRTARAGCGRPSTTR